MVFKPEGVVTALITPTDALGNLKEEATRKLLRYDTSRDAAYFCWIK